MTSRMEQETTITYGRDEEKVYIYSSIPAHVRRLRSDVRATQTSGDETEGNFTVDRGAWNPLSFKRTARKMTDAEREAAGERLRKARENRATAEGVTA